MSTNSLIHLNELDRAVQLLDRDVVVFGGTFDPIHQGHIDLVQTLRQYFSHIILAPATANPWKQRQPTRLSDRAEMIRLVCAYEAIPLVAAPSEPGVFLDAHGYTYVAEYVTGLRSSCSSRIFWAVGEDLAESVPKWKDWDTLGISAVVLPINLEIHATDVRSKREAPHPAIQEFCRQNRLYTV